MELPGHIRLRRQLVAEGFSDAEVAGLTTGGALERVRRGAYAPPLQRTPEEAHLDLITASLALQETDAVVSHVSAAVVHGLPVDRRLLGVVHLSRPGVPRSDHRGPVWRHWTPDLRRTEVAGTPVTPLADTVLAVARTVPFADAVAVVDAGLRRGVAREELMGALVDGVRHRGNATARRAVRFGDGRSESAGESHSRVVMSELLLPAPDLQRTFHYRGEAIRADFVWDEARVIGEFDGHVKYGRLLRPGQSVADVIADERAREEKLRRLKWWLVRWTWRDVMERDSLGWLIRQALTYHD
ncbi:hypothetical protein ACQBAU_15330 [Propionibacteriaceae bacterium Y2011]